MVSWSVEEDEFVISSLLKEDGLPVVVSWSLEEDELLVVGS